MELNDAILQRRSIRKFKPDAVDSATIAELLEAARLAPSGSNLQPWRFIAVTSEEMRAKLAATTLDFVCTAPLVMVCCADLNATETRAERSAELRAAGAFAGTQLENMSLADYQQRTQSDPAATAAYLSLNVAIAMEHMVLRAVELGLGSCWVFMFSRGKVKKVLDLPDNLLVTGLIPFGYPDQEPQQRPRLPLNQIYFGEV
jgi:nitroreductase